ncbi:hypothetical protein ACOME3_000050 [Neoechinorhynchus agilis]
MTEHTITSCVLNQVNEHIEEALDDVMDQFNQCKEVFAGFVRESERRFNEMPPGKSRETRAKHLNTQKNALAVLYKNTNKTATNHRPILETKLPPQEVKRTPVKKVHPTKSGTSKIPTRIMPLKVCSKAPAKVPPTNMNPSTPIQTQLQFTTPPSILASGSSVRKQGYVANRETVRRLNAANMMEASGFKALSEMRPLLPTRKRLPGRPLFKLPVQPSSVPVFIRNLPRPPPPKVLQEICGNIGAEINRLKKEDVHVPRPEDDYGISDLGTDDDTDDDEQPAKKIPSWANKDYVRRALRRHRNYSIFSVFPEVSALDVFGPKGVRQRTSSAIWDSFKEPSIHDLSVSILTIGSPSPKPPESKRNKSNWK